jgi:DNA polymerase III alpha subunit
LLNIRELQDMPNKSTVFLVARVKEGKARTSKKNNKYLWLDVSDETGDQVVMLFNSKRGNKMDDCIEMNGGIPKKESICVIKGEKQQDTIFAQLVAVQSNKIYTKLSELKNSV